MLKDYSFENASILIDKISKYNFAMSTNETIGPWQLE